MDRNIDRLGMLRQLGGFRTKQQAMSGAQTSLFDMQM